MHLTTLARHALSRGRTPAETYALLARRTRTPLPAARAVCLVLTIPRAETTRRLADCHGALLVHPRPGSETDTGELLEALGVFDVFDVPASPTPAELTVVEHFLTAIDAMGGIRPGHQHGLQRWLTTGNLTTAYLSLAAARPMPRTGDPARYWSTLVTAGELLTTTPHPTPASPAPSPAAAPRPPAPEPAPRTGSRIRRLPAAARKERIALTAAHPRAAPEGLSSNSRRSPGGLAARR